VGVVLGDDRSRLPVGGNGIPAWQTAPATCGTGDRVFGWHNGSSDVSLLAFTLAFTFALAASHLDARQQFAVDEANAIRTTYLRSAFLPEPQRSTIRDILRGYVEARLEAAQAGKVELAASQRWHARLWTEAAAAVQNEPGSALAGLFIESLNEVIDLHAKRVQATLGSRIPGLIWVTLYLVASLAMAGTGYHEGLTSLRDLQPWRFLFSPSQRLSISSQEGLFNVSHQATADLRYLLDETSR
jgi:hypothetical protein